MATCKITPEVIVNGERRDSQLFKDLMKFTNRDRTKAVTLYGIFQNPKFRALYKDRLLYDEGGEPTLSSIINNDISLKNILEEANICDSLMVSIGSKTKDGKLIVIPDTTVNFIKLAKQCIDFNNTSEYKENYTAVIKKDDKENIYISIEKSNKRNTLQALQLAKSVALNERIRNILSNSGISITALNSLEERLKSNGIVDYENATKTAEGFIQLIKLLEGSAGEQALPEEFAHFVVDVMSDDIMIQRLILLCSNESIIKEVLKEQYEDYLTAYNNDKNRLIRETAGKLIFKLLFKQDNEEIELPTYKSFFNRVFDRIKEFFSRLKADDFSNSIAEAEKVAGMISNRVIKQDKITNIKLERLKQFSNLHQLRQKSIKASDAILKSIDDSTKEFNFFVKQLQYRINRETDETKKKALIQQLNNYRDKVLIYLGKQARSLNIKQYNAGIENFISYSASSIEKIVKRLEEDIVKGNPTNRERAYILENCRNIILSIKPTMKMIEESLTQQLSGSDDIILSDDTKNRFREIQASIKNADSIIQEYALETFKDYIDAFMPNDGVTVTVNNETKTITKDDLASLLKTARKDISLMDTWLMSMAESNDIILQLAAKAMNQSKQEKRLRVLNIKKKLLAVAQTLKNEGIADTDFMFEKHADGSLSSNYISNINWTKYKDEEAIMRETIKDKKERAKWYNEHWSKQLNTPSPKYYAVDIDAILPQGSSKRIYYDTFMGIRKELVSYLPETIYKDDNMRAVQITKDLWERLKSTSPTEWYKLLWTSAKNQIVTKVDDTDFGVKTTFDNKEYMTVPIFFINKVDEKELSRDTVSTLLAFADMAINYDEMNKVASFFEIGRDVLENREANVLKNGKPIEETFKVLDRTISRKVNKDANNALKKYNEFLESQLYGRYMKDDLRYENEDIKITANKVASALNRISSLNQLALNGLASTAAVANDMINVNSEALAQQFFNIKQLREADKIYLKELSGLLGETGNPVKTNKLSLFLELFDVLHEYDSDIKDFEWDKTKIKKLLSENSLYILMHMGSHWGESRTALAQALKIMIKSDDGTQEKCLWDILKVEYIDENDHSKGAKLVAIDGYTLSRDMIVKFNRKFTSLNNRLFGIYNQADRNALQKTAVGQLVFLYRKFIVPAINRRFGEANTNLDLETETEGYYRSFGRFVRDLVTDSKDLGRTISVYWNQMSEKDIANCKRAINELSAFVAFSLLATILSQLDWNKKDNPWIKRYTAYMSKRIATEAGAFSPFGIFGETWNIVKSPAASINTLENVAGMLDILNPFNYETFGGEDAILKSGRYKGHNRAYKAFMNSPFVPTNKTIYKMLHPEDALLVFN